MRVTLFIACLLAAAAAQDTQKGDDPLPKEPKAVVVTYDEKGGFGPARADPAPWLTILRDGTVKVADRTGATTGTEGKLAQDDLKDLLRYLIKDCRLLEVDVAAVRKKLEQASKAAGMITPVVVDASTSVITIRRGESRKVIEFYALGFLAGQFPKIAELQRMDAARKRLYLLILVTQIGGKEKAVKILRLVNERLAKAHPAAKPLRLEDLTHANRSQDGTLTAGFYRSEGKILASIAIAKKGEPKVTINVGP
ncbi:MAG: hypothetical protein ACYTEZ_17880 [Planctomycetota bacterium]|jgi:hypothetical protein